VLEALVEELCSHGQMDLSECFIDVMFIVSKKRDFGWGKPGVA
jgi:hypothetical protein